ncbi:hypothetical protein D5086_020864 [Populus alba]|uniref:Uncharacterized protein n=1 Tax=Populus alba TaxID=43335 RepID=A0ACC4BLF4_POPAL
MGCSSSLPDRSTGRLGGLNNSDSSGVADAKNLRVKLVLLGDSGVGKSCIVLRFVRGQFDPTSKVTIGASFLSQTIALQDSTTIKFDIWDTAGQERYAALAPLYYRGAAVAVIVYDITSPETFNKAQYWVKSVVPRSLIIVQYEQQNLFRCIGLDTYNGIALRCRTTYVPVRASVEFRSGFGL